MINKYKKGTITIWILGIVATVAMSYAGLATTTLISHSNTNAEQDTRISLNTNNIEHLEEIMVEVRTGQNLLLDNFGIPRNK